MHDPLVIAGRELHSRLITGTGKYPSPEAMHDAVVASGCELVTVAVGRIDLDSVGEAITDHLPGGVTLLPNTAGAATAEEAVRIARLARAGGLPDWIKLEVIPDPRWLLPDAVETLKAAEQLVDAGVQAGGRGRAGGASGRADRGARDGRAVQPARRSHRASVTVSVQRAGKPLEDFVRESIVDPNAYVQPGFPKGVMPPFATLPKDQLDG